ncbi:hypothetical protein [Streptomyces shenzhenensis]|uniref:Antitoxin n=1 Tax=Streptomyces shenzhenensis TaxID=943815 RepID=A0A3M0I6Z6_9ACTN|nr:hypothetical protein [Streptomyces shenzhenensis]RMB84534.1 hypothetical protein CTZ28_17555 [Streptomyces shenzhenensis]
MGIKDQFQDKAKNMRDQAEQNAREKSGQRGQQQSGKSQAGKSQAERGRQNTRDGQDPEREMRDRMDQDYDA